MPSRSDLYPHQREALKKLKNGSVLCGGVGSGKSRTALAYYIWREKPRKLVIITTARKRDTGEWAAECQAMDICPDQVLIDSWNNIGKHQDLTGAFYIFDEQRVVGRGAWVKSFLKIARQNHWILLSATPGDTWMDYVPVFLANGYYRNRTAFCREHVVWSRFSKYPKVDHYVGTGTLQKHRNDILVEMPFARPAESHWETCTVPYDKALTTAITKNRWNPWKEEPIQQAGSLCYLLRRAVNQDPSRMDILVAMLKEHPKLIVFYNFDYELEAMRKRLAEERLIFAEWNGHRHESIPKGDSWCYLVQYTAGAEGWNCVETDTILFYSLNYSYKIMTQAAGRIDRLNTPFRDLYFVILASEAPIDQAIQRALRQKKVFNEAEFEEDLAKKTVLLMKRESMSN